MPQDKGLPVHPGHAPSLLPCFLPCTQLAGLIMWVPSGAVFLALGLALLGLWVLAGCRRDADANTKAAAAQVTAGDVARGKMALQHYGCGGCHVIPGIPGAQGQVGPSLAGIAGRTYLA